eukprot:1551775-Pleurochrysis_carterae.AAC.1
MRKLTIARSHRIGVRVVTMRHHLHPTVSQRRMGRFTKLELARWILRGRIRHVARLWRIPSRRVRVAAM